MSEKVIENNKVSVIGEIISGFTFSHEVFGEGFYRPFFYICLRSLSSI